MIQIPLMRAASIYTAPLTTTTTVSAYTPSAYLISGGGILFPSILTCCEPTRLVTHSNEVSVASTTTGEKEEQHHQKKRASSSESLLERKSEKEINEYIKEKVDEQIRKFKEDYEAKLNETNSRLEKVASRSSSVESFKGSSKSVAENDEEGGGKVRVVCHKCHDYLKKELSLDDKIKLIREELNLPPERQRKHSMSSLHRNFHTYTDNECSNRSRENDGDYWQHTHDCQCKYGENKHHQQHQHGHSAAKYRVSYVKPISARKSRSMVRCKSSEGTERERSKSAKSKSPAALTNRPPWRPTTTNDYAHTVATRADLLARQYIRDGYVPYMNDFNNSRGGSLKSKSNTAGTQTLNVENKHVQTCSDSLAAARPRFTTTTYYQPNQHTYFKSTDHLPNIISSSKHHHEQTTLTSTMTTNYAAFRPSAVPQPRVLYSTVAPKRDLSYSYFSVNHGPKHYLQQSQQSSSKYADVPVTVNLKPIEATKTGAIYANPMKNEIHYVSDNARHNWNAYKSGGLVKIHNAGTTVIHD